MHSASGLHSAPIYIVFRDFRYVFVFYPTFFPALSVLAASLFGTQLCVLFIPSPQFSSLYASLPYRARTILGSRPAATLENSVRPRHKKVWYRCSHHSTGYEGLSALCHEGCRWRRALKTLYVILQPVWCRLEGQRANRRSVNQWMDCTKQIPYPTGDAA